MAEEYYVANGQAAIDTLWDIIEKEDKDIRYFNIRYKEREGKDSRWKPNVHFTVEQSELVIRQLDNGKEFRANLEQLEWVKLRPYYYASCIGFKEFICIVEA